MCMHVLSSSALPQHETVRAKPALFAGMASIHVGRSAVGGAAGVAPCCACGAAGAAAACAAASVMRLRHSLTAATWGSLGMPSISTFGMSPGGGQVLSEPKVGEAEGHDDHTCKKVAQ